MRARKGLSRDTAVGIRWGHLSLVTKDFGMQPGSYVWAFKTLLIPFYLENKLIAYSYMKEKTVEILKKKTEKAAITELHRGRAEKV